ncbi:hypothetical protein ACMFMF_003117 [Clarireedia jacksonii]
MMIVIAAKANWNTERESLRESCRRKIGLAELLRDFDDGTEASDEREHADSEGEFVGPENPDEGDDGKRVERHQGAVNGPFAAGYAGVAGIEY